MTRISIIAVLLFAFGAVNVNAESAANADTLSRFGKYPLSICPNCGDPNTSMGKAFSKVYDGREVIFCCEDCAAPFEKNLSENMMGLNLRIAEEQRPSYPLASCLVCGDGFNAAEEPVESVYLNQYVKFCCNECLTSFSKNPQNFVGNLEAGIEAAETKVKE